MDLVSVRVGAIRVREELVVSCLCLDILPASARPPAWHKFHLLLVEELVNLGAITTAHDLCSSFAEVGTAVSARADQFSSVDHLVSLF